MKRLAICSSVHHSADARVTYREGRVLARAFDASLWVLEEGDDFEVDAGAGRTLPVRRLGAPRGRRNRLSAARRLIGAVLETGPDALLIHDPELVPRVWRLDRHRDLVTAYDVHEDYPSMVLTKSWIPRALRSLASSGVDQVERFMTPSIGLIAVADSFLAERFGRHRPSPVLVRNYPPLDLFDPGPTASERLHVIAYVGGITAVRGSHAMIESYRRARHRVPDAQLLLIGPVQDDSLPDLPEGVTMTGRVAYDKIGDHLVSARAGLAIWADTPKNRHNIPSKIFDYMAAGVPFVTSDFENIRDACDSQGGLFCAPDDIDGIADGLVRLLTDDALGNDLQAAGSAAVSERYNFDAEGQRLIEAINRALGDETPVNA